MKTWYSYKVKIYIKGIESYQCGKIQMREETPIDTLTILMGNIYPEAERFEVLVLDELNGAVR